MGIGSKRRVGAALLALTLAAGACSDDGDSGGPGGDPAGSEAAAAFDLEVVSTRAEYVTGGDVLVALTVPEGADATAATFTAGVDTADGEAVDADVRQGGDGRWYALVSGLPDGPSEVTATLEGESATVTVTNHPVTGPLFSGPHLPLPVCTTEGYGLGEPTDDDCSAPTQVRWSYRTTDGEFAPLDDPTDRPDDLATTEDGDPFIVREESGTINRGIYWIRMLEPEPTGADAFDGSAWNDRLVYTFGGGCGVTYTQGFALLGQPDADLLAEGYAFATSTFNTFQTHCNDVLSAETALMVKEHFVETYGVPTHTIGLGGSGGAIQQYLVAQNYPGILDAVGASLPFPDAVSIAPGVVDCNLLNAYYRTDAGAALGPEQRTAINGHLTATTCDFWERTFGTNVNPTAGCSLALFNAAGGAMQGLPGGGVPELPADLVYGPDNPDGLRCTLQDGGINVMGADPDTGFGRRPLDNTGVQYGLSALVDGDIDLEQFLTLNERIGGFDIDGNATAERMRGEDEVLERAYSTGRIVAGGGPLSELPVVTVNVWTDPQGDIHDRFRAFSLRERLGGLDEAPGHVIWTRALPEGDDLIDALTGTVKIDVEVVHALDAWLTALDEDAASGGDDDPIADRLARTRPDDAIDNCVGADGERTSGADVYDGPGPCTDPYPVSGDARTVSGAPLRNDVIACALVPVAEAIADGAYGDVDITEEALGRLEAVFPDGVCDWDAPGRGQVALGEPWQTYGD